MKKPVINVEEANKLPDAFPTGRDNLADSLTRRMASGEIRIPRGVYRFKTLEEADEWMDKMIARSQPQKD